MKPFCRETCKDMTKSSIYLTRHKLKLFMLLVLCTGICHLLILNFSGRSSTDAVINLGSISAVFSSPVFPEQRLVIEPTINQDTVRLQILNFTATDKHEDTSSTVTTLSGTYSLPVQPKNPRKWQDSFAFIYSNGRSSVTDENAPYVAVFPYSTREDKVSQDFVEDDKLALQKLSEFLDTMEEFDGATCSQPAATANAQKDHVLQQEQINIIRNSSLDSSWCRFIINKWSLHIRNTGRIQNIQLRNKLFTDESSNESSPVDSKSGVVLQICNIIQGPFIIRKDVFHSIGGLLEGFGRVALQEFFIRSKGELKMAKLSNCAWTREITRVDRGTFEGSNDVPEYAKFGNKHGILRIVTDNRIEWTGCVANWKLCPEKPYVEPRELPGVAAPICCSAVLFQMLKDFTWAFTELGVEYRVVYGTLLGAVRSQAIIPWTCDIDIALNRSTYDNASTYTAIEKLLRSQYYVGNSFMGMPRAHMLIPPYIEVDTAPFFDDPDDLQGNLLFSSDIEKAVKDMLPVSASWRDRGYVDFYVAPSVWLNDSALVTINNQQFITLKEIEYELTNWYGKDYRQPVYRGQWEGFTDQGNA